MTGMQRAPRIHGGTDAMGAVRFDFSTNSNACGPCPLALAAVQAADASRYPDAGYTQLRLALAAFHGLEPWRIVLAASASEFIFRISAWTQRAGGNQVWIPAAAYGDYAHAASASGLQSTVTQADAHLVWACEPSSPLGQAHTEWPETLQKVVLDCAYAPLRLSGAPGLNGPQLDQVWRLYSPNKVLALTGVRAAYAIAPALAREAAGQLDALAPSWPVGAHGEAMLLSWTQQATQAWIKQCLPVLVTWKTAQVTLLQALGWHCLPSHTNFFCAKRPAQVDMAQLVGHLRTHGIKVRDTASLGLPGWVRLSVQPPAAQQALQTALAAAPVSGQGHSQAQAPVDANVQPPAQANRHALSTENHQ